MVPNNGCGRITSFSSIVRVVEIKRIADPSTDSIRCQVVGGASIDFPTFFSHISWTGERSVKLLPILLGGQVLALTSHLG